MEDAYNQVFVFKNGKTKTLVMPFRFQFCLCRLSRWWSSSTMSATLSTPTWASKNFSASMLETAFDYFYLCARYNILWWEKECWFIDVSQAVEPIHPSGLDFLFRLSSFSCLQVGTLISYYPIAGTAQIFRLSSANMGLTPLAPENYSPTWVASRLPQVCEVNQF